MHLGSVEPNPVDGKESYVLSHQEHSFLLQAKGQHLLKPLLLALPFGVANNRYEAGLHPHSIALSCFEFYYSLYQAVSSQCVESAAEQLLPFSLFVYLSKLSEVAQLLPLMAKELKVPGNPPFAGLQSQLLLLLVGVSHILHSLPDSFVHLLVQLAVGLRLNQLSLPPVHLLLEPQLTLDVEVEVLHSRLELNQPASELALLLSQDIDLLVQIFALLPVGLFVVAEQLLLPIELDGSFFEMS